MQHAKILGQKMLLEDVVQQHRATDSGEDKVRYLDLHVPEERQIIEAYDIHQGEAWHDGLNHAIPEGKLQERCQKLVAQELDAFGLSLSPGATDARPFSRH